MAGKKVWPDTKDIPPQKKSDLPWSKKSKSQQSYTCINITRSIIHENMVPW